MGTLRRTFSSPALWIPLMILAVLGALCYWYYSTALQRSELAINKRIFQSLGLFADQFRGKLVSYRDTAERAPDFKRMSAVFPEVHRWDVAGSCNNDVLPGELRVTPIASLAGNLLCFSYQNRKKEDIAFEVPAETLLRPFLDTFHWDIIRDVFLADTGGNIIYQSPRSNVTLSSISYFYPGKSIPKPHPAKSDPGESIGGVDDQPSVSAVHAVTHKGGNSSDESAATGLRDLSDEFGFSRVTDVKLNGETYRLYTVPVRVPSTLPFDSFSASSKSSFLVGGIVPAKDFSGEARLPLGNAAVGISFLLAIALLASYPLLKFRLMKKSSLVHREEGFVLALQMTVTAALIAGAFGHLILGAHFGASDDALAALSVQVEDRLVQDVRKALMSLETIEAEPGMRLLAASAEDKISGLEKPDTDVCADSQASDKVIAEINSFRNEFEQPTGDKFKLWPAALAQENAEYALVFWTDRDGYQVLRYLPSNSSVWKAHAPKPDLTRVCDWSSFVAVQHNEQLWSFSQGEKPGTKADIRFHMDGGDSSSVGQYLIHISRRSQLTQGAYIVSGTIGTRLPGLSHPVLLPGYGFAILDQTGQVMFHSDWTKSGKENFLYACDRNQQLSDFMQLRQAGTITLSYAGMETRVFVRPIARFDKCPWSIVTFYNTEEASTDHVKAMIIFGSLLGCYFGLISLAVFILDLSCIRLPKTYVIPSWLCPRREHVARYWHLAVVLTIAVAATFPMAHEATPAMFVVIAIALPYLSVLAVVISLYPHQRILGRRVRLEWTIALFAITICIVMWRFAPGFRIGSSGHALLAWSLIAAMLAFFTLSLPRLSLRRKKPSCRLTSDKSVLFAYTGVAWALLLAVGFRPALALMMGATLFQADLAAHRRELKVAVELDGKEPRGNSLALVASHDDAAKKNPAPDPKEKPEVVEISYPEDPVLSFWEVNAPGLNYDANVEGHLAGLLNHPASSWFWPPEDQSHLDGKQEITLNRHTSLELTDGGFHAANFEKSDVGSLQLKFPRPALSDYQENGLRFWIPAVTFALLIVVVAPFWILHSTLKRLFATEIDRESKWATYRCTNTCPRIILLGLPASGKTSRFRSSPGYVDLIDVANMEPVSPSRLEASTTILDHFEICCGSYLRNRRVLRFMEELVKQRSVRIQIISTVDPIYFLRDAIARAEEPGGDPDLANIDIDRWIAALVNFQIRRLDQTIPAESVEESNFYSLLWSTCSGEERLALNQLARHAWPNYAQKCALEHLHKRGLVKTHGVISIDESPFENLSMSFAEYIRSTIPEKSRLWWVPGEDPSTWEVFRLIFIVTALLAIIGIALVYGDRTVAYVTTGATALTTVTNVIANAKNRVPIQTKEV